ncbi:MAG: hypothetical protein CM15mP65_02820 [Crocinitomicaceae bacterium]|nr:MAG: hypothetical protein CM15mP65_02820 [Crocinitomicaceae bacterium]
MIVKLIDETANAFVPNRLTSTEQMDNRPFF